MVNSTNLMGKNYQQTNSTINQEGDDPGAGFETSVSQPAPAPKGAKRVKSQFTDSDRQALIAKFKDRLPDPTADIDQALNHKAKLKAIDLVLYVDGWLRRETLKPQSRGTTGTNSAPAPRPKILHPVNIASPEMMAAAQKVIDDDKEHQRAKGRA